MKYIKFALYILYNASYRNGTNKDFDFIKLNLVLLLIEIFFLLAIFGTIDRFANIRLTSILFSFKFGFGLMTAILLYFLNDKLLIKNGFFQENYTSFKNSPMDTSFNKAFVGVMIFVLLGSVLYYIGSIKKI